MLTARIHLTLIRALHTLVWAGFVACIIGMPLAAALEKFTVATWLAVIVAGEVCVLALNHWHCPLTAIAARYTTDRRPNFDIWLPQWIALHNQHIFGSLYALGLGFTAWRWWHAA